MKTEIKKGIVVNVSIKDLKLNNTLIGLPVKTMPKHNRLL
jgi:hypothetical protein